LSERKTRFSFLETEQLIAVLEDWTDLKGMSMECVSNIRVLISYTELASHLFASTPISCSGNYTEGDFAWPQLVSDA
jgi:hypothetical protein